MTISVTQQRTYFIFILNFMVGFVFFLYGLIYAKVLVSEYLIYLLPVLFFIFSGLMIFIEKYLSLIFLFFCTSFIFMNGLSFAYFLGVPFESVANLNYMINFSIELYEFLSNSYFNFGVYLLCVVVALNIKYFKINGFSYKNEKKFAVYDYSFWIVFYIVIFYSLIFLDFLKAYPYIRDMGYLGFYTYNNEKAVNPTIITRITGYLITFLPVVFGYSYTYFKSKKQNILILMAMLVYAISLASLGQRGMLFCLMLLMLSLYSQNYKINFFKLMIIAIGFLFLAQFLFFMRAGEDYTFNLSLLSNFFHQQGVSFLVYNLSLLYEFPENLNYSVFVPAFNFIASLLGFDTSLNHRSYADFLAAMVNPEAYSQGMGLGWALIGDFIQLFSLGNYGIIIGIFVFGVFLGFVDSANSHGATFLKYTLFTTILFLPRSSSQTLILPIIACCLLLLIRQALINKNTHE